jgi:UDP-glucuronate decarboxylase
MISGLIALMEHDGEQPGAVNLGNPIELTVGELVQVILQLTGSRSRVVHSPLPVDDPKRRRPNIERADAVLGWRPRIGLEQGLKSTIAWFGQEAEALRSAASTRTQTA